MVAFASFSILFTLMTKLPFKYTDTTSPELSEICTCTYLTVELVLYNLFFTCSNLLKIWNQREGPNPAVFTQAEFLPLLIGFLPECRPSAAWSVPWEAI